MGELTRPGAARDGIPGAPRPLSLAALAAAITSLENLPPIDRARAIPPLIEQAKASLSAARAAAISEAEQGGMKRAGIARQLGVARQQVTKILGPGEPAGQK